MTKSTIYAYLNTNDIITNYNIEDNYLMTSYRNGDDYEKSKIFSYNGIDFMNNLIELPNNNSEIDNIIKYKKFFTLSEIKDLLIKYKNNLPSKLIDYNYLDENLALTLFFEYLYENISENNYSFVYLDRL